jgi:hypothetical protein
MVDDGRLCGLERLSVKSGEEVIEARKGCGDGEAEAPQRTLVQFKILDARGRLHVNSGNKFG